MAYAYWTGLHVTCVVVAWLASLVGEDLFTRRMAGLGQIYLW